MNFNPVIIKFQGKISDEKNFALVYKMLKKIEKKTENPSLSFNSVEDTKSSGGQTV